MKKNRIYFFLLSLIALTSCGQSKEVEEEKVSLSWYINFSWFDKSWGEDKISQYITQQTGIDVEYIIPTGDESQFLNNILNGNISADIITFESWNPVYTDFLAQDYFLPLDLLAQEYQSNFLNYTNRDTMLWYSHENHLYVYPNSSYPLGTKQSYSNQTFLVRKDIYEGIGSPDMSTPEGFLKALEDAKNYCTLVNEMPLIPIGLQEFTSSGNSSLEGYLQNFLAIPYEENNQVVDRLLHPDSILWLNVFHQAYQRGLLLQDVFTDKRVQMEEKIANGQYFAMLYQWSDCSEQLLSLYENNPESSYIAIDGPKNTQGENHTLAGSSVQGWTITGISAKSAYEEEALELLTFLMSDQGQRLIFLGIEDVHYTMEEGEVTLTEDASLFLEEHPEDYSKVYGGTDILWPMMNPVYAEEQGYIVETHPYFQEIQQWSQGFTENFSLYTNPEVTIDSPVYYISQEYQELKGEFILDLILAENESEFQEILSSFVATCEEEKYQELLAYRQTQLELNKKKLDSLGGYYENRS